jgi:hypothetical protein
MRPERPHCTSALALSIRHPGRHPIQKFSAEGNFGKE